MNKKIKYEKKIKSICMNRAVMKLITTVVSCRVREHLGGASSIGCQRGNGGISDVLPVHALVRLVTDSSDVPADRQHSSRV